MKNFLLTIGLCMSMITSIALSNETESTITKEWDQLYEANNYDNAYSIVKARDGGYLIGASTEGNTRMRLIKIDEDGVNQWEKSYPGVGGGTQGYVAESPSGNIVIGSGSKYYILDNEGNVKVEKELGYYYAIQQIISTGDNFMAVGSKKIDNNEADAWIMEFDNEANTIFEQITGGEQKEYLYDVSPTSDGGFIATGHTNTNSSGDSDILVIRYDSLGNKIWQKNFGDIYADYGQSIVLNNNGTYTVGGRTTKEDGTGTIASVFNIDDNGNEIWKTNFTYETDSLILEDILSIDNRGVLVAGYTMSTQLNYPYATIRTALISHISQDGKLVSQQTFDGYVGTYARDLVASNDENYIFVGTAQQSSSSSDSWAVKFKFTSTTTIPANVTASDGTLKSVVGVSWSEVANAEYYNIYRSELQNNVGEIVGVSTSTSFVDDTIEENTKYYYRINACNDIGCSDYSVADSGYIGQVATPINPAIIMYLLN